MELQRIQRRFGSVRFSRLKWALIEQIASTGIVPPVEGRETEHDEQRWRYCSRPQSPEHALALLQMLADDVQQGRTL
eukprot:476-Heterococcus_DN1.PRE.1